MKNRTLLVVGILLVSLFAGCSRHATGPNKALFDYLGNPVVPPANVNAAYTRQGLTRAIQDAAQAANVTLTKVEIDDSEFPFLVGVLCANKGDVKKLEEQIRKMPDYNYGGSVNSDTVCVMNVIPYSAYPMDARKQISHRLMLREAVFYNKIRGNE